VAHGAGVALLWPRARSGTSGAAGKSSGWRPRGHTRAATARRHRVLRTCSLAITSSRPIRAACTLGGLTTPAACSIRFDARRVSGLGQKLRRSHLPRVWPTYGQFVRTLVLPI
jgi:hypothetical protein